MKAATAATAIWSYISISSLRYASEMLQLGYNAYTWRLIKYCRHDSIWQIMSPNSVWAFIRMRHDHRQFVILDFRLERGNSKENVVCHRSRHRWFYCYLNLPWRECKLNCTTVAIPSHIMLHKVTVGYWELQCPTTCQLLYFSMSVPLVAILSVWGTDLSLEWGRSQAFFQNSRPPALSAGYKQCFVPQ